MTLAVFGVQIALSFAAWAVVVHGLGRLRLRITELRLESLWPIREV